MNQQISSLLQKPWLYPALSGLAGLSGGVALGYILGRRKSVHYEFSQPIPIGNITSIDEDESGITVKGEFFPDITIPNVDRIIHLRESEGDGPEDHPQVVTVHLEEDSDWNIELEMQTRQPDEPYVIHRDEFFNDEMGFTQSTVTYYSGDDILTDELDTPIYGHTAMVGELKFGHGSGDPNVVYIRSEILEHEYEVLLHYGRYEVEVLGNEIDEAYKDQDLKHSNVRKFKMD